MIKQSHLLVLTLALAGLACGGGGNGGSGGSGGGGVIDGGDAGSCGAGVDGGAALEAGWLSATGGSWGGVDGGAYPSQACIDRANTLLGQMTADEKYAQMLQMERAALTTALVTQYGVGSGFSQGGSAPSTNSPAGWADMADGYRQAALASRLKIPFLYGADEVHGVGTVKGATVFPHNIGLGATRDPALARGDRDHHRQGEPGLRRGLRLLAGGRGRARRALGTHLRGLRRDHRAGLDDGRDHGQGPAVHLHRGPAPASWPTPSTTSATAARPTA